METFRDLMEIFLEILKAIGLGFCFFSFCALAHYILLAHIANNLESKMAGALFLLLITLCSYIISRIMCYDDVKGGKIL